jgi:hypothetical protein
MLGEAAAGLVLDFAEAVTPGGSCAVDPIAWIKTCSK